MATGQLLNAKFGWDRCDAVVNGTFCFGVKGNVTSYPAGTGCFKTRDCDAFVHGDKGTDPQPGAARSHYMTWLIFAKTNVSNDKDTRVHFYITRDPEPVEPYPKYYPQDVLFVMGHRWTSRIPTFRPGPLPLQCSFIEEKGAKVSDCFRLINTANKLDNYWQDRGSGEKYEIAATGHTINWHGWLWSSQAVIMYPQSGPTVYSLNPRNRKCHPTLIVLESNLDSHGVEKSVTLRNYGTTSERVDLFGLLNAGEVGIDIDAQGRPLTTTTTTTTTTQAPITTTDATSTEVSSATESTATITSIPTTTDTSTELPLTSKGEAKKSNTTLLVVLGLVALLALLGACAYFLTKRNASKGT
ncbi:hypothetical protein HDE_04001 [Halotydeus destructor]|nr:hypothetical protein HDE_04001 [Halotydeus destructor]